MELIKCLFGVVALVCAVAAQYPWAVPLQKHQPSPPPPPPPQLPQQQSNVPPPAAPFDRCHVEDREKIRCGTQDITAEQCGNINCCFDGRQCYYGKAVTVQCTRDGQFVVVVARDATVPHIDVDSVSLLESNDPSCGPVDYTSAFTIFQFPVTACGTTVKEEAGFVVYENHMSSSYEVGVGPKGSITRDSHFELLFQCRYSGTAVEALVLEVNDVPPPLPVAALGPLRVELKLGNGQCRHKGCIEEAVAYSSFYTQADYPVSKVLREPLYVDVGILERSDPNIVLTLDRCWATANPNPQSLPQWDILLGGCPFTDDRYETRLVPVDPSQVQFASHHKRFIIQMFTFVDPHSFIPQKETVFLHCSTAVCHPTSTNTCQHSCHRQRRSAPRTVSSQRALVSSGEVILRRISGR